MAGTTQERAAALLQQYNGEVERIRGNKAASREGKRADLARAYLEASQRMEQLWTGQETSRATRRQQLVAQLFGTASLPGDPASLTISRRDAMDRVARLEKSQEGIALLGQAVAIGDDVLARAVAHWGYERRDANVVNAYLNVRPQADAAMNELWAIPDPSSPLELARRHMSYALERPAELGDVADMDLQAIADGRELKAVGA